MLFHLMKLILISNIQVGWHVQKKSFFYIQFFCGMITTITKWYNIPLIISRINLLNVAAIKVLTLNTPTTSWTVIPFPWVKYLIMVFLPILQSHSLLHTSSIRSIQVLNSGHLLLIVDSPVSSASNDPYTTLS